MASYLFISSVAIISFILNLIIVRTKLKHIKFTGDINSGPQKIHTSNIPRIGGVGIYLTLIITLLLLQIFNYNQENFLFDNLYSIIIISFPAVIVGIAEDIFKDISIFFRLSASFFVGLTAYFNGINVPFLNVNFIDEYLVLYNLLPFLTIVFFASSINSINVIDGINGLAGLLAIVILLTLSQIALQNSDYNNYYFILLLIAAIFGFLLINWFTGNIFLGDCGAYLLGTILAFVSCNILYNNNLSLLNILTLFSYPIWEISNSIIRRLYNNKKIIYPDNKHLHSLTYIYLTKKFKNKKNNVINSLTTLLLIPLIIIGPITTLYFYKKPQFLFFSFLIIYLASTLIYVRLYYNPKLYDIS